MTDWNNNDSYREITVSLRREIDGGATTWWSGMAIVPVEQFILNLPDGDRFVGDKDNLVAEVSAWIRWYTTKDEEEPEVHVGPAIEIGEFADILRAMAKAMDEGDEPEADKELTKIMPHYGEGQ